LSFWYFWQNYFEFFHSLLMTWKLLHIKVFICFPLNLNFIFWSHSTNNIQQGQIILDLQKGWIGTSCSKFSHSFNFGRWMTLCHKTSQCCNLIQWLKWKIVCNCVIFEQQQILLQKGYQYVFRFVSTVADLDLNFLWCQTSMEYILNGFKKYQ